MNKLKVALCFLDMENNPVVIRPLKSNWSVELGGDIRVTERSYRNKIQDEISEVLTEQIKLDITPEVLLSMLKEIEEK